MTALFKYFYLPCPMRFGVSITYTILRGICLLPRPWLLMSCSTPFVSRLPGCFFVSTALLYIYIYIYIYKIVSWFMGFCEMHEASLLMMFQSSLWVKMGPTVSSEMSLVNLLRTLLRNPKTRKQYSFHSESFRSRIYKIVSLICFSCWQ
jgi:hypothetical protein